MVNCHGSSVLYGVPNIDVGLYVDSCEEPFSFEAGNENWNQILLHITMAEDVIACKTSYSANNVNNNHLFSKLFCNALLWIVLVFLGGEGSYFCLFEFVHFSIPRAHNMY